MSDKRKDTLEFSDLSKFDIELIKNMGIRKFVDTNQNDAQIGMIEAVFRCIFSKGYKIVLDESRTPSWSKLEAKHFTEAPVHNNWWKEKK